MEETRKNNCDRCGAKLGGCRHIWGKEVLCCDCATDRNRAIDYVTS